MQTYILLQIKSGPDYRLAQHESRGEPAQGAIRSLPPPFLGASINSFQNKTKTEQISGTHPTCDLIKKYFPLQSKD